MDFGFVILHFRTPLAVNAKGCMNNNLFHTNYRIINQIFCKEKIDCILKTASPNKLSQYRIFRNILAAYPEEII